MRKFLSVTLVAVLTAMTAGCECWNCLTQFEACKNQALFGTTNPLGCGTNYQQYPATYGYDCAGYAGGCAGVVVQSPVMSSCGPTGCDMGGCGPAGCGPAGCGVAPGMVVSPGQSYIAPGQVITPGQVVTPPATVIPGPETYAPTIQ
jgi:hypothetical protein